MTNISLTRVNQKLNHARQALRIEEGIRLSAVELAAKMESAAFHLVCAYQHYLCEIAETYYLKRAVVIKSEVELKDAFEIAKKFPAEADELISLRQSPNSWLVRLQAYYDSLWQTPMAASKPESGDLISLVNLDTDTTPEIDISLVTQWLEEFTALVIRQRQTSAEF